MKEAKTRKKSSEDNQKAIELITEDFKRALRIIQKQLAVAAEKRNRKKELGGE
tara:strand:- start:46 stop:204 length:159 start_codon:yes stop_codon:yes gene_type:complete